MARWSVEYLRERFVLDEATGQLFWKYHADKPKRWNTRFAGKPAGSLNKQDGYIDICIDNLHCRAHSVVWALVHGCWPEFEVDHRDGVRNNNKPRNLRSATPAEQRQNMARRSDNSSGYTGVVRDKRRSKWVARIHFNGKQYHAGQFATPEEARDAYATAKAKLHIFEPKVREG